MQVAFLDRHELRSAQLHGPLTVPESPNRTLESAGGSCSRLAMGEGKLAGGAIRSTDRSRPIGSTGARFLPGTPGSWPLRAGDGVTSGTPMARVVMRNARR
jgi:hypothetical protein